MRVFHITGWRQLIYRQSETAMITRLSTCPFSASPKSTRTGIEAMTGRVTLPSDSNPLSRPDRSCSLNPGITGTMSLNRASPYSFACRITRSNASQATRSRGESLNNTH